MQLLRIMRHAGSSVPRTAAVTGDNVSLSVFNLPILFGNLSPVRTLAVWRVQYQRAFITSQGAELVLGQRGKSASNAERHRYWIFAFFYVCHQSDELR